MISKTREGGQDLVSNIPEEINLEGTALFKYMMKLGTSNISAGSLLVFTIDKFTYGFQVKGEVHLEDYQRDIETVEPIEGSVLWFPPSSYTLAEFDEAEVRASYATVIPLRTLRLPTAREFKYYEKNNRL